MGPLFTSVIQYVNLIIYFKFILYTGKVDEKTLKQTLAEEMQQITSSVNTQQVTYPQQGYSQYPPPPQQQIAYPQTQQPYPQQQLQQQSYPPQSYPNQSSYPQQGYYYYPPPSSQQQQQPPPPSSSSSTPNTNTNTNTSTNTTSTSPPDQRPSDTTVSPEY